MYVLARQWGIQPSEFWGMTMAEWFCEYEFNSPKDSQNNYAGNLTQGDVDRLTELLDGYA